MQKSKIPKTAYNKMMDYLARRDHSEQELRQKLQRADYSNDEIETAIEEARERGWLLPPEELAQKVAEQLHRKLKGELFIQGYLRTKGLPSVPIERDLEIEKALAIVSDLEDRGKKVRKLQNRGFSAAIIGQVIYEEC